MPTPTRWIVSLIAACGVAGLAGSAAARGGEAFLSLSWVDTGNNNGLIEPGESAIITLSSLQNWDGQGNEYIAFGGTIVDVITTDAGVDVNGHTIMNGLADIDPPGDTAEEIGGNLENASFLQFGFLEYVTDNPIGLMYFRVDFTEYTPRTVSYTTNLTDSFGLVGVLVRERRHGHIISESWAGHDGSVNIRIVPNSAGILILSLGGLTACRRNRDPHNA